jgi:arylsulfatase A-like enzyme
MPWYQELAHTPLLIWDPRSGRQGVRCDSLVQTIDLPATLLDFFGIERPKDMQGIPLKDALADGAPVHDAVLFGTHGRHVHCTDGRYHLMVAPGREPHYEYTLMPTHMWKMPGMPNGVHSPRMTARRWRPRCLIWKSTPARPARLMTPRSKRRCASTWRG